MNSKAASPKILAVIQARGGSKGIPKKNIYPVAGHPLIAYTISAALGSKKITDLVVSTDSEQIAEVSRQYGAQVPFLRPAELAGDTVTSVDSLHWAVLEIERIKDVEYDCVIELPCVSPLRSSSDIDGALDMLIDTRADSVISMADTGEKHPIRLKKIVDGQIRDFTNEYPEPKAGSRRQDLKPTAYIRNGAIYAMTRDCLIEKHSRHGEDSRPYIMPAEKSVNIDERFDLVIAEALIEKGYCENVPRIVERQPNVEIRQRGRDRKLLVTTNLGFLPEMKEKMEDTFDVIFAPGADRQQTEALLPEADGWMCSPCPTYQIDGELLRRGKRLRALATPSTGSNHVDVNWCREHDLPFFCLKGTDFIETITASSEFTFALVLELTRKTSRAVELAKQGFWRDREDELRGIELSGKTLGIIGYGRIGSNNARYAHAFDMKVVAFDPYRNIEEPYVSQMPSYQKVLEDADIVMVCVHLDETTRNMVNRHWFERMKNGVYFLNTSRGEVVDERALLDALENGKVKAAAVDVITSEMTSNKKEHPMIKYAAQHDNLIVTPHIAGLTVDSEYKAAQRTFEFLKQVLGGAK